ncbi:MAG: hypothetical protein ACXV3D_05745 [Halobacteriota archaeon]
MAADKMFLIAIDPVITTLIAVVLTLIASLLLNFAAAFLDARRQRIKNAAEKKALRDALYTEIAWTAKLVARRLRAMVNLIEAGQPWDETKKLLPAQMSFEVYHYTREQPALFYQLHDAKAIENFYRVVNGIFYAVDSVDKEPEYKQLLHKYERRSHIQRLLQGDITRGLGSAISFLDVSTLEEAATKPQATCAANERDRIIHNLGLLPREEDQYIRRDG